MFSLQTETSFDAAHFLPDHPGLCRNLHGHRWRVVLEIAGADLQTAGAARGMLCDFAEVKAALKRITEKIDHKLLYEAASLAPETLAALQNEGFTLFELPFRPTAEELARWFYRAMSEAGFAPARVWVYETPENCAAYWE
ncbi:MAG TPA: 6-carboxytetrahydropterin synthase QueD [Candidatus Avidehalobacter gallistercoris]|uniref:6-carboxy-5,6,7,8-tetrahydropterin synthase n=1 Tax=Candidatus Avidehalobacter gallistercoris TaxID=2840694 RepID=A0A9D1HJQ9_9FIRM|nr:6-carboxytetrahydropterin synthase QueD [Candidatus Avidehalobacter gallistercoris]